MKILFILTLINVIFAKQVFSLESVYETNFFNIEINNELILDAKNREIEIIKKLSLDSILQNILTIQNYNKILEIIQSDSDINNLVQNILIDNEFISPNKYKANIKINFDPTEIVNLLRVNKINYSDLELPHSLIVVAENTSLAKNGLTKHNSFYKFNKKKYLISKNLLIPNLSLNDRFILPFKKIKEKNKISLKNFATKYDIKNIFIIYIDLTSTNLNIEIKFFSIYEQSIQNIGTLKLNQNQDYYLSIYNLINNWWKIKNQINNSVINKLSCILKNSNIHELHKINNKINSISQIKSNIVKNINFGLNVHQIHFYGDLQILSNKLKNIDIDLVIDTDKKCIIYIK